MLSFRRTTSYLWLLMEGLCLFAVCYCFHLPLRGNIAHFGLHRSGHPSRDIPPKFFSRVIQSASVLEGKQSFCRLIASKSECESLSSFYQLANITSFESWLYLTRRKYVDIEIVGNFSVKLSRSILYPDRNISSDFDTKLLDSSCGIKKSFANEADYDDEISSDGTIDVGDISAQYLIMNLQAQKAFCEFSSDFC